MTHHHERRESIATSFTAAAAVVLLFACSAKTTPMDTGKMNAFATRYTTAWCSQNAASVAAHFATDGSLTINAGEPAVGREAITASAQAFMSAFPDMVVQLDSLVLEGEHAEYHWTLIGTNTGPGGSGKPVRISGYEEWTMSWTGSSKGHWATSTRLNTRGSWSRDPDRLW